MSETVEELNPYFKQQLRSALAPEELELILFPTEKCNFRCVYCYEDFKLGRMSARVLNSIKSLMSARASSLNLLKVNWFGGEPLLAKEVVFDIAGHAKALSDRFDGLRYVSGMTTNGYLLDLETARRLVDLGVRDYQVSVDGDEEEHNKTRLLANGGGTFDVVWGNLLALTGSDLTFRVTLRIHVTKQNAETMLAFVEKAIAAFGSDPRIFFFVKCIENLGGAGAKTVTPDKKAIADILGAIKARAADAGKMDIAPRDGYVCYAARPNSFIVRSDGSVGKCTTALKASSNNVGHLSDDGSLELDVEKLQKWFAGYATFDKKILSCPVFSVGWK